MPFKYIPIVLLGLALTFADENKENIDNAKNSDPVRATTDDKNNTLLDTQEKTLNKDTNITDAIKNDVPNLVNAKTSNDFDNINALDGEGSKNSIAENSDSLNNKENDITVGKNFNPSNDENDILLSEKDMQLLSFQYELGYSEYIDEESCNCSHYEDDVYGRFPKTEFGGNYPVNGVKSAVDGSWIPDIGGVILRRPKLSDLRIEYWPSPEKVSIAINDAVHHFTKSSKYHQRLVIFCHGFLDYPEKESFQSIRRALKLRESYDALALNSHALIGSRYLQSVSLVPEIGRKLGETLVEMTKKGVNISGIHLIGHSLGAHISGFAGKTVKRLTGQSIGRISGLDPAGPCFKSVLPEDRLKRDDADFVDVIHTDNDKYGHPEVIGHVDYFPNGGSHQPGCSSLPSSCNHLRVWRYYAESIRRPEAFAARRCPNWDSFKSGKCEDTISYMGYPASKGTHGVYCLRTNNENPFGLGNFGLKYL